MPTMTPQAFIAKWKPVTVSERASAQEHFVDLCGMLGHPTPLASDPDGSHFTFEKGVHTTDGRQGWADVWKKGHFAWEYKRAKKHKSLANAYQQLLLYREDLENPPLLVVCDIGRTEVHTNFTGTAKCRHDFSLAEMGDPKALEVMRGVFFDPERLRPGVTRLRVTEDVAERLGSLADRLRLRGTPDRDVARFLMKLIFCMFAEDVGLLEGEVFTRLLRTFQRRPRSLRRQMRLLFMSMDRGGPFGADRIAHFNGGLFADTSAIEMTAEEIVDLLKVNECDWGDVEPSIFGTLLERTLDPLKHGLVGTHYTGKADIMAVLEPVLMTPLRREWHAVRAECDALWLRIQENILSGEPSGRRKKKSRERTEFDGTLMRFAGRLAEVKILDPACGSGNFLYVAMNLLLDLEKEVIAYGQARGCPPLPFARPGQMLGIERHPFAQELAQVVVWIGYLQWKWQNGLSPRSKPVLDPGESIRLGDAVLERATEGPREPEWPECDFIVGNPPFLGGKRMRSQLGDGYVDDLFRVWDGRVPAEADLCCYWFEKARAQVEAGRCRRAGLLATQGIRGGANRDVLKRIKGTGDIFFGESDRDWVLDGANVHVSMVGFDAGEEKCRTLDGKPVERIHSDLSCGADVTQARRIPSRAGLSFMGDTKGGPFEMAEEAALRMLASPNPDGRPNSDVVVPWVNGKDLTGRNRRLWIIDFGTGMAEREAALYEAPFEHARTHVFPVRQGNRREAYSARWWVHVEARPGMRVALGGGEQVPRPAPRGEAPVLHLAGRAHAARLPARRLRLRGRLPPRPPAFPRARGVGEGAGDPGPREGERIPLHADHLLRDVPVPPARGGAAHGDRRGGAAARHAAQRVAEPARVGARGGAHLPRLDRGAVGALRPRCGRRRGGHRQVPPAGAAGIGVRGQAREAHADGALQHAAGVAGGRAPGPRRGRVRRVRVEAGHGRRPGAGRAAGAEPGRHQPDGRAGASIGRERRGSRRLADGLFSPHSPGDCWGWRHSGGWGSGCCRDNATCTAPSLPCYFGGGSRFVARLFVLTGRLICNLAQSC